MRGVRLEKRRKSMGQVWGVWDKSGEYGTSLGSMGQVWGVWDKSGEYGASLGRLETDVNKQEPIRADRQTDIHTNIRQRDEQRGTPSRHHPDSATLAGYTS
ncbi:hypothetical protein RRG08_005379 [Elysia crispata]|uniref:Uncharacterized protein n=1 Tax=Elysia crispata TaxID=231223 RepID=A0AAE1A6E1_9GAST|nr:hypothetical protein RRG08_005379 [Elysia crispata]